MNNTIKSLANGDFEVHPLDDPKFIEFQKKREENLRVYREMNDWLFEIENYGTRMERLYEDLGPFDDIKQYSRLLVWLEAAFNAGRDGK